VITDFEGHFDKATGVLLQIRRQDRGGGPGADREDRQAGNWCPFSSSIRISQALRFLSDGTRDCDVRHRRQV